MTSLVFLAYAAGHLGLFIWSLVNFLRWRQPGTVPLLLVTAGLVYDNVMLGIGGTIGHGSLLMQLSVPRFFLHAIVTPLLMLSALGLVRRTEGGWLQSRSLTAFVAMLTLVMIGVGFYAEMISLKLEAQRTGDLLSYGNAGSAGPPVAPIATILVLIAAGVALYQRGAGPWLLAGSLIQFTVAVIGDAIVVAGNLGELALLAGLVVSDWRLSRWTKRSAR